MGGTQFRLKMPHLPSWLVYLSTVQERGDLFISLWNLSP